MELTWNDVKDALREVLEEELGIGLFQMTQRFSGGTLIFKPNDPALKSREIPIEAFFKKITAVRERLRVLEQKINAHESLSPEEKAELQMLITRSYGSLTTFNFLFRNEDDQFQGLSGKE
jgi:hypothetical protein